MHWTTLLNRWTLTAGLATLVGLAPAPSVGQAAGSTGRGMTDSPAALTDTLQLPGLVVTATRVPVRAETLPTPITVITFEELQERGVRTVADALRTLPSASIAQAGPQGGQTSLFLRGGQSGYVKVLVDGVPMNDPGGAVDLADLSTDQVERIEVVRGPASVLYGSDAVTGVVQVFTRRGRGDPSLAVVTTGGRGERRHEDGRYGTLDASGTMTGSTGTIGYSLGGGRSWNAGAYPLNNDRRHDVLNARLHWGPGPSTELAAAVRFSDSDTGMPTDGAGNLTDANARIERRTWTAGVDWGQRLAHRVTARLHLGLLDRDQLARDEPDTSADTLGVFASSLHGTIRRLGVDARLDVDLPRSVLSLGGAAQDQRGTSSYSSRSEWGPYDADAEFRRRNRGYYAQLLTEPFQGLHVTLGGRLEHNEVFGTFPTHRLGLAYGAGATRVRAATGRAFREPTFAESYGSGFGDRGNENLVPERSMSWEVGLDRDVGRARISATWFHQRFEDMIQFTSAAADPAQPNYFNVGAARSRGLEVTAEAALGPFSLAGSHTWLDTRVLDPGLATDAGFVLGDVLLRRPARSATLTGRYGFDRGSVSATARHLGRRHDLDFGAGFPAPRVVLPAHTVLDLAAEHRLPVPTGTWWSVLLRVENALDTRYETVRGFPAPGRLVAVGVRMRT
jgi:vitamin B12 transporter